MAARPLVSARRLGVRPSAPRASPPSLTRPSRARPHAGDTPRCRASPRDSSDEHKNLSGQPFDPSKLSAQERRAMREEWSRECRQVAGIF